MSIETVKRWYWIQRAVNKLRRRPKQPSEKLAAVIKDHKIDLVLDVGANIGQTGGILREIGYKGRIVSFEPLPSAHAKLTERAAEDSGWTIAPRTAIGDSIGTATIYESEASDVSSLLPAKEEMYKAFHKTNIVGEEQAPVATLDSLYDDYAEPSDRVYLKIDTQGYEKNVLLGATETLKRIVGLQVELSLLPLYDGETTYLELLQMIHDLGFHPYILTETSFSVDLRRQLQIDAIFFRD